LASRPESSGTRAFPWFLPELHIRLPIWLPLLHNRLPIPAVDLPECAIAVPE